MKQSAARMSKLLMVAATGNAHKRVQDAINRAAELTADTRSEHRKKQQQCRACYYFPTIAGQSITFRDCMCCGETQTYGSTNTDVLCMKCAVEHFLCRHCGGDIEMCRGRRHWPNTKDTTAPAPGQEGGV